MKRMSGVFLLLAMLSLLLVVACGGDDEEPTTTAPGLTAADLQAAIAGIQVPAGLSEAEVSKIVADAMAAQPGISASDLQAAVASAVAAAPAGVTAAELQAAIAAIDIPTGLSQSDVSGIVSSAMAAQPGISAAEVSKIVSNAIAAQPGISASDLQTAVDSAVAKALPTAVPVMAVLEPIILEASKYGYMMSSSDPKPKYGGTVRTAGPVEMAHWDLHQGAPAYTGITNVYNNLTYRNVGQGQRDVVPDLAVSWEISSDGMTYTFPLREGVKWHDGVEFTSADVQATFDRILNPPSADIVTDVTASRFEMVESVSVSDKYTVQFTLKRPTPWFVNVLGGAPHFGYAVIYPKHFLDANDQNVRSNIPPGTGAFKFKDRLPGEYLEMEANPNYWNSALPYVDGIRALHIPVWANRGTAVLTGLADFTWNGDVETWNRAHEEPDKYKTSSPPVNSSFGWWINNAVEPLDDPRVRRAMLLAIDKDFMHEVTGGVTIPQKIARWVTDAHPDAMPESEIRKIPGYRNDPAGRAADIAEAQRLLADAGYPDGFNVKVVGSNAPAFATVVGVAFLQQLEQTLNITSDLEVIERGLEGEALVEGNWGIGFMTGPGPADVPDPTPIWNAALRCDAKQNHGNYCDPAFDLILDRMLTEFDPVKRKDLLYEAMDHLDQNPPVVSGAQSTGLPMGGIHVMGIMLEDVGGYPWGRYETVWLNQ